MSAAAISTHFFWITSRAAGTVALVLASASVGVGLSISGRIGKARGPDLRVTHEALSLAAIAAVVLHGAALLGDSYFHPTIADLVIPFHLNYKEPYMAVGIIGGWGMIIFGLSYYVRDQIGVARWKVLHRLSAVAWILGVIHTLGEGTDAGTTWFLAVTAIAVVPVAALLLLRLLTTPASSAAQTPQAG
ncbi:MAG: ferric reductase-like transmembrane domain-containing protein [Solirubrobacteraceae bacterium]|jgi:sulfoxide reductase heme-binding subunit YedZ